MNINEIKIGSNIQIEQENQIKRKRVFEYSEPPFKVTIKNYENVIYAVQIGRNFKIMEIE